MNDTSALLGQLKIDRGSGPVTPRPRWPWLLAATVVLLLAGVLVWRALSPDLVTVSTAQARPASSGGSAVSVLDATGYVVARRRATVSSKITGKVAEVYVEEGQTVEQGEVLARIDDVNVQAQLDLSRAQLDAARAQLAETRVQLAEAERQLVRNRELAARKLVSEQALDAAQAGVDSLKARLDSAQRSVTVAQRGVDVQARNLDDTIVRAPFAGVITVKNAQPGEMISPLSAGGDGTRTGIGTLVDMDSLEIEVDVNENFINRVSAGQPVTARLNAYPNWEIPAEVIAVIPTADRSKATVKVRIGFKEKDPRILPDMGVRVAFREVAAAAGTPPAPAGVLVPPAAIQVDGDRGVVFVLRDERLERRAVRVGGRTGDGVRVLSGIVAGETLAVGDFAKLEDGARVKLQ